MDDFEAARARIKAKQKALRNKAATELKDLGGRHLADRDAQLAETNQSISALDEERKKSDEEIRRAFEA